MISDKFKAIISLTYSYVKLATFLDLYKPAANNAVNEPENIPKRIAALKQRIRRILGPWVHWVHNGPFTVREKTLVIVPDFKYSAIRCCFIEYYYLDLVIFETVLSQNQFGVGRKEKS